MKYEKTLMKQIINRLDLYKFCHQIDWWGRLNSLKVKTVMGTWVQGCPKGTPDFIVLMMTHKGTPLGLFIEAKSSSGTLRPEQMAFMKKYQDHPYIHVIVVREIEELDDFVNVYGVDKTKELPDHL